MATSGKKRLQCVIWIFLIFNPVDLTLDQDDDQNIDSYEETFSHEFLLDNHDIEEYEQGEQGYDENDDYQEPETRHEHVDQSEERHQPHRDGVINMDALKEETLEMLGNMNPETLKLLNIPAQDAKTSKGKANSNVEVEQLKKQIEKLESVDKNYRESISALLATTAQLRVQIMQMNNTIKRLDERDREKDDMLTELQKVIKDNKYDGDQRCDSAKESCPKDGHNDEL